MSGGAAALAAALLAGGPLAPSAQEAPAGKPAAEFSHRRHLALPGLTCVGCHAAAEASTSSDDDVRPDPAACRSCHGAATPTVTPRKPAAVRPYRFNHKLHLAFGSIAPILASVIDAGTYLGEGGKDLRPRLEGADACGACHRGMRETDAVSAANLPRMADCLVCHSAINPPTSCAFCHKPGVELRPARHTPAFADVHSSKAVAKVGCVVCHGRRFTCMGCH